MNEVLRALKAEKQKWLRQMEEARQQLETVQAAMKLVSGKAGKASKRSAAARRKMSLAAKRRWARAKSEKKSE